MTKSGWIVILTLVAVACFLGGRASVRVDDQDLRDSLAVYRFGKRVDKEEKDSLRTVILVARTRVAAAEHDRDQALRRAGERSAAAAVRGARADSLELVVVRIRSGLQGARTLADSVRIIAIADSLQNQACAERRNECADLRSANADLSRAIVKDTTEVIPGLRKEIAAHLKTRGSDSTRLVQADRLIGKLEKNALGCRLPLLGVPCPTGILNYDLTCRTLQAGLGMPLKRWLTVSVTKQITRPKSPAPACISPSPPA